MTAWDALKAASSLLVGSAWALITHPKTGGTGVVMNDGFAVEVAAMAVEAELADAPVQAELQDTAIVVDVPSTAATEVEIPE